jgi:alpha-tubulin suppressor-like RCC1 family protein
VPALVEGLEGVCGIASACGHSLAVTQSESVFSCGVALQPEEEDSLCPVIVEGFGEGGRMRRVCAGLPSPAAFAIGEDGEIFSWGNGEDGLLGHGDEKDQPSAKRVEALQGIRVSSVSVGTYHALALAENGLLYVWGKPTTRAALRKQDAEVELLPTPVEALRDVRMGSVAAAHLRSYAVSDTGELLAWGVNYTCFDPLGHGEVTDCPLPKPIESLRGIRVDTVVPGFHHMMALTDDGSVYASGNGQAATSGALGLGEAVSVAGDLVPKPQRVPALRVACVL